MTNKKWTIKQLSLLIAILLLSVATVGGTLAYIFTNTDPVQNTFTPSEVTCMIDEEMSIDKTKKENVKVVNTGDTEAYIRAAVVVTWQNADGEVLGELPVLDTDDNEGDYIIDYNSTDWTKGDDGYWYYKSAVGVNATTENLINSCVIVNTAPAADYTLHVEIIADAIQAEGVDSKGNHPVELAWKVVTVDANNNLVAK